MINKLAEHSPMRDCRPFTLAYVNNNTATKHVTWAAGGVHTGKSATMTRRDGATLINETQITIRFCTSDLGLINFWTHTCLAVSDVIIHNNFRRQLVWRKIKTIFDFEWNGLAFINNVSLWLFLFICLDRGLICMSEKRDEYKERS